MDEKTQLLKEDLHDALRWLFVGAVTWEAARKQPHRCGNQDALAMFTSLTQARALYEFFYAAPGKSDDARARDFCPASAWNPSKSYLYLDYMAAKKPANKRVFHLVYDRADHAGGLGEDGPDHLKNQVLNFARDLRRLTEEFIKCIDSKFHHVAGAALHGALAEAKSIADYYEISDPL